jgi:hypothetical protein
MLVITGKIVMIESKEIVKNEVDRFMKVTLVIVKQMKGVKRNISFESYGRVSKEILSFRNGERIRVFFTIDSVRKNENWFHVLKAIEVEKEIKAQKKENIYQNKINYDTIEKNFRG